MALNLDRGISLDAEGLGLVLNWYNRFQALHIALFIGRVKQADGGATPLGVLGRQRPDVLVGLLQQLKALLELPHRDILLSADAVVAPGRLHRVQHGLRTSSTNRQR